MRRASLVLRHAIRVPARRAGGFAVDRRGLMNTLPPAIEESKLTSDLRMLITALGPMTVAEYMAHALQHPLHGYYTGGGGQIGKEGDFTTAPEISQLFGEAIAVWCVSVWEAMGKPASFQLVEMGPGKGTLMADVLRASKQFKSFRASVGSVHMVETSPYLRAKQRLALGAVPLVPLAPDEAKRTPAARASGSAGGAADAFAALISEKNAAQRGKRAQAAAAAAAAGASLQAAAKAAAAAAALRPLVKAPRPLPEAGAEATSKRAPLGAVAAAAASAVSNSAAAAASSAEEEAMSMGLPGGGEVHWHTSFSDVPEGPIIFIGQEILDALPVHQFEYTRDGWRERLVDIAGRRSPDGSSVGQVGDGEGGRIVVDLPFRFVLSRKPTPACTAFLRGDPTAGGADAAAGGSGGGEVGSDAGLSAEERVRRALAFRPSKWREEEKAASAASPTGTASADAACADAASAALDAEFEPSRMPLGWGGAAPGDGVEVCPAAHALVQDIAARVAAFGGGALLVDYGADHAAPNSLRGFFKHHEAHVLFRPGEVDLTADVDFASLRRTASRNAGVKTYGPVDQGAFLSAMGCPQRLEALVDDDGVSDEAAEALVDAYERLVDPAQMGSRYKCLAIVDSGQQGPPPGGFGAMIK